MGPQGVLSLCRNTPSLQAPGCLHLWVSPWVSAPLRPGPGAGGGSRRALGVQMPRLSPRPLTAVCLSGWTDELSVVRPRQVFARRRNDVRMHAAARTDLENIPLRERWQMQRVTRCVGPLHEPCRPGAAPDGWTSGHRGRGTEEPPLDGTRVSFWGMKCFGAALRWRLPRTGNVLDASGLFPLRRLCYALWI